MSAVTMNKKSLMQSLQIIYIYIIYIRATESGHVALLVVQILQ